MRHSILVCVALLSGVCVMTALAQEGVKVERHAMVYHEPGRFGGWPANHGIWSWGNEILVGFTVGYYRDLGPWRHAIDSDKPQVDYHARSLDGGETWTLEVPAAEGFRGLQGAPKPWPDHIDFTHPGFALRVRMMNTNVGPSLVHYSYDRGKTWEGPFLLPQLGTLGIAGRTDYIVDGKDECTLFLSAAKSDRREGRPMCARTTDGARTWQFLSWIGPEPHGWGIMPASARLSDKELFVVVRRREGQMHFLAAYRSQDNGETWEYVNDPVADTGRGNPASLIRLADGRLCLTYGVRSKPFRMCAKLSRDGGRTWSDEIVLRDDGAAFDVGYPRSVQRPDGKVVTLYYFNDAKTGPERYIAATIWDPGK